MKLLDEKLIKRFKEVGEQMETKNPLILAKFYTLFNDWKWYISEYHSTANAFYGYRVIDWMGKWAYFKLPEIEWTNEIHIQRDFGFAEVFFNDLKL